jgi:thiol:disulfide interchange protein
MGAVAALLAGACVAPVVIQVVLFSSNLYAKGNAVALALPFLLGVGMAIPWPIAGAGIAALPKPGAWMVRVKQVFGVVIMATALLRNLRRPDISHSPDFLVKTGSPGCL